MGEIDGSWDPTDRPKHPPDETRRAAGAPCFILSTANRTARTGRREPHATAGREGTTNYRRDRATRPAGPAVEAGVARPRVVGPEYNDQLTVGVEPTWPRRGASLSSVFLLSVRPRARAFNDDLSRHVSEPTGTWTVATVGRDVPGPYVSQTDIHSCLAESPIPTTYAATGGTAARMGGCI